jgi:hypothetical protein
MSLFRSIMRAVSAGLKRKVVPNAVPNTPDSSPSNTRRSKSGSWEDLTSARSTGDPIDMVRQTVDVDSFDEVETGRSSGFILLAGG